MTVKDIEREVRNLLGQPDPANSRWDSSILRTWMNDGQELAVLEGEILKDERYTTSVIGQEEYALPPDCLAITAIYFDGERLTRRVQSFLDERVSQWRTAANSTPKIYYNKRILERTKTIGLHPKPDSEKRIDLMMLKTPAILTSGDSVPEIPDEFHRAIIYYVCYRAKLESGEAGQNEANVLFQEFMARITRLKSNSQLEDRDTPLTMIMGDQKI